MSQTVQHDEALPPPGVRFWSGIGFFTLSWVSPLFVPLVVLFDLPVFWKTTLSAVLVIGGPEVFGLVAIACLGRSGFRYLAGRIKAVFKRYGPPRTVSRQRYRVGLVMLFGPMLLTPFVFYAPDVIPYYEENRLAINLVLDFVFVSSFLVLGGAFWDKVRSLFVYEARAEFPPRQGAAARPT